MKDDTTNRILTMIVVKNRNFSKPRRVWCKPPLSPPPKILPAPESDACSKTQTIKIIDRLICIYGNIEAIINIDLYYYKLWINANIDTCFIF